MLIPPLKKKIKHVGIITKSTIFEHVHTLKTLVQILEQHSQYIFFDEFSSQALKKGKSFSKEQLFKVCDLVVVIGGDGTMLKTAANVGRKPTLVLGVNIGNVGFLTQTDPQNLPSALDKIFANDYFIEKRSLLEVDILRKSKKIHAFLAFNEAVINQGLFARLIELIVEIQNQKVISFKADGMIIATPTGSTAHSLSAGGPIVHPALDAVIITPICPAALSLRPIVIPHGETIIIRIATQRSQQYDLGLTIDGQVTVTLQYGDIIRIHTSQRYFHMIHLEGAENYYKRLRSKLGWGR